MTTQLNMNFVRAARVGDELIGSASVQHAGRRTCVCKGEVRTASGELVASGLGTILFVPMPSEDAEMLLALGSGER